MESLLATPEEQMDLISDDQVQEALEPALARLEARGNFTAERLFIRRPEAYKMIVALVGHGMGQRMIADALEVSPNTVRAVELREKDSVDTLKKRTANQALMVSRMCLDAMEERLDDPEQRRKIPFKDLAIAAGVAATKHQELSGDVVLTMGSNDFKAGAEAFAGFLSVMGSVAETAGQKAADPAAQAKPVIDLDTIAPDNETSDHGSETKEKETKQG